jgi:two-component system NtrC family sensor kinase
LSARRSGIGLKPLIALQLLVVLGLLALLLAYAGIRLSRHGLVIQRIDWVKSFLHGSAGRLLELCPRLEAGGDCPGLSGWAGRCQASHPSFLALSLYNPRGDLAATTDADLAAGTLWDAFGEPGAAGGRGGDWSIGEHSGFRVVAVAVPLGQQGWMLRGIFSLKQIDREAARFTRSILLYAALLCAVMLLLGWVLLHRLVVRPMDRLLQSADRISEGDLGFLLSAERGSELGRLGFSLGRMARRIEEDQKRLRDQIEELTRLNRELHQAQQGLIRSEKLASVGRLAAGLAHEIGNPISAILAYLEMLQTEEVEAGERRDVLFRVRSEVERIDTIIRDLLAYSRPGRGNLVAVDARELVENAMALIRPQKKFKLVEVAVELFEKLPRVQTDPDLVQQVLVNLLVNALDALDPGGHLWVRAALLKRSKEGLLGWPGPEEEPGFFDLGGIHRIRPPEDGKALKPGQSTVVFAVVDDGPGIEADRLNQIFDPFYTTKEPGQGTGLGLAICHASIHALGGEIWAFSRPGQGTQMAFSLPVAQATRL